MATRIITAQDKAAAKRFKAIYLRKKDDLGLTQVKLGKAMSLSQSSVANYMRGEFSMNLDIILRFAKVLQVDAHDIDPKLDKRFSVIPLAGATTISVLGTISGRFSPVKRVAVRGLNYMAHQLAVVIDTDVLSPVVPKGSTLIVDPKADYVEGSKIVVQYADGGMYIPYELVKDGGKTITVRSFQDVDKDRRDLLEEKYFPHKPIKIPLSDVSCIFKVVGLQYP